MSPIPPPPPHRNNKPKNFINVCGDWLRRADITRVTALHSDGRGRYEFTVYRGSKGALTFRNNGDEYKDLIDKLN